VTTPLPVPRPLGAHMSVAGGAQKAIRHAAKVNAEALQIFTKSQLRWRAKELTDDSVNGFRRDFAASPLRFLCAHVGYLINLASPDPALREKSLDSLVDEILRASLLGCSSVVMHPGSPKEDGLQAGLERIADGIESALKRTPSCDVAIALENTAGQGATIGSSITELGQLLKRVDAHPRIGLCVDTCHAFAAGVDWRDAGEVRRFADEIEKTFGVERLQCFHLNDSKTPLGSHRDRHEHIGRGEIGEQGFANLLAEPAFAGVPGILETPKDDKTLAEDIANIATLRRLERGMDEE